MVTKRKQSLDNSFGMESVSITKPPASPHKPRNDNTKGFTKMSVIIRQGSTYKVADESDIEVTKKLPAKTFVVKFHEMSGTYFLTPVDDMSVPSKLYGNTHKDAKRIINTFNTRDGAMGVHLNGVKGSGKTLLSKVISEEMRNSGVPTIIINEPHCGDGFNQFIQQIDQKAVIIFDEFEKVYGHNEQEKILTLLDGVYPTKKLFIVTTNDKSMTSEYMKNRPSRIRYYIDFGTIDPAFVEEYCQDNLDNKDNMGDIIKFAEIYSFLNFDMLSAMVSEMNMYNETLKEAMVYLNVIPTNTGYDRFERGFIFEGKEYIISDIPSYVEYSPLTSKVGFDLSDFTQCVMDHYYDSDDEKQMKFLVDNGFDPINGYSTEFDSSDIVKFDKDNGIFVYGDWGKATAFVRRQKRKDITSFLFD